MIYENAKFLILETSGRIGQVAVAQGTTILGQRRLDETRRHARDLAPSVKGLLGAQGWKARDIEVVFVSIGPGSYTGLRVGIMSAKAFAYATGCRLIGVETFAAIALPAEGCVHVIADAQQNNVYWQSFACTRSGPEGLRPSARAVSDLAILPVVEWLKRLTPDSCVTGPGLRLHRQLLPQTVQVAAEDAWDPRLENILLLGLGRLARGEHDPVFALEPLYARRSSAEENWASRQ